MCFLVAGVFMTDISNIKIGQVVRSKTGRDVGKYFVVIGKESRYVYLADGDVRRVEAPKKKNVKHIQVTGLVVPRVAGTDAEDEDLSNRDIRFALTKVSEGIE